MSPRPTSANRCNVRHVAGAQVHICQRAAGHRGDHSHGAFRWAPRRSVAPPPPLGVSCADLPDDPPLNARNRFFPRSGRAVRRP